MTADATNRTPGKRSKRNKNKNDSTAATASSSSSSSSSSSPFPSAPFPPSARATTPKSKLNSILLTPPHSSSSSSSSSSLSVAGRREKTPSSFHQAQLPVTPKTHSNAPGTPLKRSAAAASPLSTPARAKAQQTPAVLIGIPESPVPADEDCDIYCTKLGGKPVWFDRYPQNPAHASPSCDFCRSPLFLVMQAYCPLEDSPYHRVLWIWGCNRRRCMGEVGSWKVLRGHQLDREYATQLAKKKAKKDVRKSNDQAASAKSVKGKQQTDPRRLLFQTTTPDASPGSRGPGCTLFGGGGAFVNPAIPKFGSGGLSLGDLWNSNVTLESTLSANVDERSNADGNEDPEEEPGSDDDPEIPNGSTGSVYEKEANDAAKAIAEISLNDVSEASAPSPGPSFPPYYLYVANEDSESDDDDTVSALVRRAAALHMNMDLDVDDDSADSTGHGGNSGWSSESYEKAELPRGMDKTLQRFMRRVSRHPTQCVRYDARSQGGSGSPLLYSLTDGVGRTLGGAPGGTGSRAAVPPCPSCGGPRSFECQLMPNVLSVLPTANHVLPMPSAGKSASAVSASGGANAVGGSKKKEKAVDLRHLWNADGGMEFGTVLVYACERDCHVVSAVGESAAEVGYFEEVALVQLEQH